MTYKTPGVYIEEISKFPPSVAEVATAVPAFIGYTERADRDGDVLTNIPTKVMSLLEYQQLFGGAQLVDKVDVALEGKDKQFAVKKISLGKRFYMYESLRLFFDNGGGKCYIVSVGSYKDSIAMGEPGESPKPGLRIGLDALSRYDEPTIILFPDAVALSQAELSTLQQQALAQCARLQDRVAVFDVREHDQTLGTDKSDLRWEPTIDEFRQGIGINDLKYGAAYTPWLRTTYGHDVPFRVFAGSTTTGDKTALDRLTTDDKLNGLVAAMNRALSDVGAIDSTVKSLLTNGEPSLKDREAALRRAVTDAKPADVNAACAAYVAFVRSTIVGVTSLAQSGKLLGDGLKSELTGYAKKHLSQVAREIIAIEKNADVRKITGLTLAPSPPSGAAPGGNDEESGGAAAVPAAPTTTTDPVDVAYGALNGTHWLVDSKGAEITVGSISAWVASPTAVTAVSLVEEVSARVSGTPGVLAFVTEVQRAAITWSGLAQEILYKQHTLISNIVQAIQKELAIVPPSGAIAGVYAKVDATRGVWKAPANVSLSAILEPVEFIDFYEQEDLNVDVTAGKSINAIRPFTGMGTLVWGARTLAGNDNEWRYVSVRRFFNMVEESVKKSTSWAVFEPNDANLWTKVKSMIDNYLVQKWRDGALAGPTPDKAFFVKVGLGQTMTAVDILEGRLIIEIGMAVVRPAEFIVLKFSHKMQEA